MQDITFQKIKNYKTAPSVFPLIFQLKMGEMETFFVFPKKVVFLYCKTFLNNI